MENSSEASGDDFDNDTDTDHDMCRSSVDMEHYLHYSLVPSVIIILVLCCLEKRLRRWSIDRKLNKLYGRVGVVIPFDFVATFSNRWSFGFAFGATADKLLFLFGKDFPQPPMPIWVKVFWVLLIAIEVGLSSYPFFVCLTTSYQKTGATLGFLYTLSWLIVMLVDVAECPHSTYLQEYGKVITFLPSILCQLFLLGRFFHILVKSLHIHGGQALLNEETSFLEDHQMKYVQRLMKKPPPQPPQKSWILRNLYEWDPYFQFPSRMISTAVVVLMCLYKYIIFEVIAYVAISRLLRNMKLAFENSFAQFNESEELSSLFNTTQEFFDVFEGVWIVATVASSLLSVCYVLHILACYRKHIKRLRVGNKSFLLPDITAVSHSLSAVAMARYSSWQIAYMIWGYTIMQVMQCVAGMVFMYVVILPMIHGQWIELIDKWGTTILSIVIIMAIKKLQFLAASRFFLQPKISPLDKQKPLALDNRKAFQNFTYFLFFCTVVVGLFSCLMRLLRSIALGTWLIGRIDRPVMPKGYEACDMGFKTWVGMLLMDHYHTNPVLVSFCHILVTKNRERELQRARYKSETELLGKDPRMLARSRTRWLLLYTLLNNPSLRKFRKPKSGPQLVDFPLKCSV
ncbi:stimulated by retinoic acid gene 6 protein-like [Eublepharis macularius]|uniref:Stimulated by retinoic acid gene 6 protein-like n=1 Tax=Eublepharis macularius TaxID=481883 RepID=A0AA97JPF4_EUBMA|nr:stimulated by retinoic acid gene 6 protein-like [Eublepharis macularius]